MKTCSAKIIKTEPQILYYIFHEKKINVLSNFHESAVNIRLKLKLCY